MLIHSDYPTCRTKPSLAFSGSGCFLPSASNTFNTFCSYLKCHICTRGSKPSLLLRLSPRTVEEQGEGEEERKMKVMAPATTTTTTWLSVVVRVCANGGHVACWFVSQHTQTGGEHLSCDGRTDGRAEEGRTNTQPRVGEREAADAWNDEASPAARRLLGLQRQRKDCLRLTARLRRTRWYFDQFSDGGDDCGDGCCGNGCSLQLRTL